MSVFSVAVLAWVGLIPLLSAISTDTNLAGRAAIANDDSSQPNAISSDLGQPELAQPELAQMPSVLADTGQSPGDLNQSALAEFFLPWQIGEANFYQLHVIDLFNAQPELAASDVELLYRQGLRLADELLIDAYARDLAADEQLFAFIESDLGLWGLQPSCYAECTEPTFALDVDAFLAIAAKTSNPADDDFFKLVQAYYDYGPRVIDGQPWGWPTYFRQTWDYGGYSLLGEGKHLALLLQMDQYLQVHGEYLLRSPVTTFVQQVQTMRHQLLQDILVRADCSGPESEAIEAELTQILAQVTLSPIEKTALQQRLEVFQTGGADIQTGCQTGEPCTCEGG